MRSFSTFVISQMRGSLSFPARSSLFPTRFSELRFFDVRIHSDFRMLQEPSNSVSAEASAPKNPEADGRCVASESETKDGPDQDVTLGENWNRAIDSQNQANSSKISSQFDKNDILQQQVESGIENYSPSDDHDTNENEDPIVVHSPPTKRPKRL